MISLLIISSILTVAVAQQPSVNCFYRLYSGSYYGCELLINNPNGFNNFTEIGGTHLEGFTNADVAFLERVVGVSSNIPSVFCNTFPNITLFELSNTGVIEIDDAAFSGCSRIDTLTLAYNRISSISTNAFANLPGVVTIDLDNNLLTTLSENVFASQQNLVALFMNRNPFNDIPAGLFQPLVNLRILGLNFANLTAINSQWFASNTLLSQLYLLGNRIAVSADSFVGLNNLNLISLAFNGINEIPAGTFAQLPNLQVLYLSDNNFTELQTDSFPDLENLIILDIRNNPIDLIHDGAFRGLASLTSLDLSSCRLRQLPSNSFDGLGNLISISLDFNEIEELSQNLFAPSPNLNYIGLWGNRLKILRRNSFGTLANLEVMDLDENVVNAIEREIIDDAVNLNSLYFTDNLCASRYFANFRINRAEFLPLLERCFTNLRYVIDTITEGDDEFTFFEGPNPGIAIRVNSGDEVQIALTPFNFVWTPMIEIFIGTENNTRSVIRINQATNVVTVPTPNIIRRDQWSDFRVTWANHFILVYSGNDIYPFMGFTMQDFFPVNFYGLRAVGTRAVWSVHPFQL